jgi:hypothetical protein
VSICNHIDSGFKLGGHAYGGELASPQSRCKHL